MHRTHILTVIPSLLLVLGPLYASAKDGHNRLRLELAVSSTIGVWELSREHQSWVESEQFYDYEKLATRTSKIGYTIGPDVTLALRSYFVGADIQLGDYRYRGGGTSSVRAANIQIGWRAAVKSSMEGRLAFAYQWTRAGIDGMDTLYADHTVSSFGLGFLIGSQPQSRYRWRFRGIVPTVVFTHLFSWKGLPEHSFAASAELLFGIRPKRSPLFVDIGYGFWVVDHPFEVRRHDVVMSYLSTRHGLVLRLGVIR